jgi:hypothetical protein
MASSRANAKGVFAWFLPVRDIGEGQPTLGEEDPKQSVHRAERRPFHCSRQHGQLLAEREVLQHDCPVAAADQSDRSEEHHQRRQHAVILSSIWPKIKRVRRTLTFWRATGAELALFAATAPDSKPGAYYGPGAVWIEGEREGSEDGPLAWDDAAAKQLFDQLEAQSGVRYEFWKIDDEHLPIDSGQIDLLVGTGGGRWFGRTRSGDPHHPRAC